MQKLEVHLVTIEIAIPCQQGKMVTPLSVLSLMISDNNGGHGALQKNCLLSILIMKIRYSMLKKDEQYDQRILAENKTDQDGVFQFKVIIETWAVPVMKLSGINHRYVGKSKVEAGKGVCCRKSPCCDGNHD